MYQEWRDLLFLHWEYPASTIQRRLPAGLRVDTFEGKAWLGIVPFFMQNVRPRFLPAVPGLSNFLELNLRTYVYDRHGIPGVWFFSLDANQRLAVSIARKLFHLPYEHARMNATRNEGIHFHAMRSEGVGKGAACMFEYTPGPKRGYPPARSLEFFLVERYRLYAGSGRSLWRGAVFHEPYPLREVNVGYWDELLLAINGFEPTGRPPDHALTSPGVDVTIFPPERVE